MVDCQNVNLVNDLFDLTLTPNGKALDSDVLTFDVRTIDVLEVDIPEQLTINTVDLAEVDFVSIDLPVISRWRHICHS